jgi:hypothetical protein
MKKEQQINAIVLIVCVCLYFFVRWFRQVYGGNDFKFIRYHLSDAIAPIVVLSYSGYLLNIKKHHSIKRIDYILLLCLFCSFVWEFCARFLYPVSVSDWIDVCSIFIGGVVYWIIINLIKEG